ncbi:hypothetical protein DEJ01_14965 [Curtobacterium sp. MCLR17_040]|nr:hypothetical protein DEJ01_14965 [Curtobacterium sp. MCLR17_040]
MTSSPTASTPTTEPGTRAPGHPGTRAPGARRPRPQDSSGGPSTFRIASAASCSSGVSSSTR